MCIDTLNNRDIRSVVVPVRGLYGVEQECKHPKIDGRMRP